MTRSRRVLSRFGGALALAGLVGCGGATESHPTPTREIRRIPDAPPTSEALELAQAQCDYLERCDPDGLFLFAENSRSACEEYFACGAATPPWASSDSPSASMHEACVESLRSRDCPDLGKFPYSGFSTNSVFPWGSECGVPSLLERLAPPRDAPGLGKACISGLGEQAVCQVEGYCVPAADAQMFGLAWCGTCETRPELGEPCSKASPCALGTECVVGLCAQIKEAGEPCSESEECTGYCEGGTCARPIFAPIPYAEVVDRECDAQGLCGSQAGLRCEDGLCRPLPNEGEPCGTNISFSKPPCRLGQFCIDGRCAALGCTQDLGESCDRSCAPAGDCAGGVCAAADTVGAPCHVTCSTGLFCSEGRCERWAAENGTPCDFDQECSSQFCDRDLTAYCSPRTSCSIPACDRCGICADPPTVERCE